MALSTASLVALVTAVTEGADATAKTTALMAGLIAAVSNGASANYALTPNQQLQVASIDAEVADNIADFVTALEVS